MIFAQTGRIATQFRGSRRELDSISKHVSFFSCWYSRTKISQIPRLCWWEWWRNYRLHKTQDDSSLVANTIDYNISMTDLGTCLIPVWAKKNQLEKNRSFADNNGMKVFHDALKSSGFMADKDVALNRRAKLSCADNKLSMIIPPAYCHR